MRLPLRDYVIRGFTFSGFLNLEGRFFRQFLLFAIYNRDQNETNNVRIRIITQFDVVMLLKIVNRN